MVKKSTELFRKAKVLSDKNAATEGPWQKVEDQDAFFSDMAEYCRLIEEARTLRKEGK